MLVNRTIVCDEIGRVLSGYELWWVYIVASVLLYAVGFGLSSSVYGLYYFTKYKRPSHGQQKSKRLKEFKGYFKLLISGDTIPSKILITSTLACNIIFLILTVYRAYVPHLVEYCFELSESPEKIIELLVVLELIGFAVIRLFATNNIAGYWLDIYTIIDILTLPHIFVSVTLGVDWLGLRSARFFWLTQLITVFRFIPRIRSQDNIDILSIGVYFFVLLLFGTGIFHLLEYSNDPWEPHDAKNATAFLSYAYFIIVTITTVGYGDITPKTAFGQVFMVVYIVIGLAFFAALLPIMSDVASSIKAKNLYAKFDKKKASRHVIVCGHITAFTAQAFLKDFLHPDRGDSNTHVLFLHPTWPKTDLKNVLRSYYTRVQYIAGSVLNSKHLQKSKLFSSSAVFILADKYTNNPLEEDNGNLLRLVSIKNTTTEIPVIIQLLLGSSKKQVKNIEGWNPGSDIAVCLNELKLGLLAQSCLCPGFSTLIANLFYTSDFPALTSFEGLNAWKEDYIEGASNEIYTTHFSPSFEGKNFQETAHICYNKLKLILLAFESPNGKLRKFHVNPSDVSIVVKSGLHGTRGYFIGQDIRQVAVVNSYCEVCDGDMTNCMHNVIAANPKLCSGYEPLKEVASLPRKYPLNRHKSYMVVSFTPSTDDNFEELDDQFSTYIHEPKKLQDSLLQSDFDIIKKDPESMPNLEDHIVLCVFADDKSPLLGLHNFLFPLRNKNIPRQSMKSVVIVSQRPFLKREWPLIRSFPEVYVVEGCPLRIQNLQAASIDSCSVCIITTMLSADSDEPAINDKEVVLCSLSIQKYLKRNATRQVQIIADLRQESNVQFLDFGDEDEPDERIYKAQPFACGEAFSVSMMDSVTSSAFHSPGTLYLVEDLIQCTGTKATCQIVGVPLNSEEYDGKTFQDLFNLQLDKNNLVLGLYRKLPGTREVYVNSGASISSSEESQGKHYVITSPNRESLLNSSDIAFVLVNKTIHVELS